MNNNKWKLAGKAAKQTINHTSVSQPGKLNELRGKNLTENLVTHFSALLGNKGCSARTSPQTETENRLWQATDHQGRFRKFTMAGLCLFIHFSLISSHLTLRSINIKSPVLTLVIFWLHRWNCVTYVWDYCSKPQNLKSTRATKSTFR